RANLSDALWRKQTGMTRCNTSWAGRRVRRVPVVPKHAYQRYINVCRGHMVTLPPAHRLPARRSPSHALGAGSIAARDSPSPTTDGYDTDDHKHRSWSGGAADGAYPG